MDVEEKMIGDMYVWKKGEESNLSERVLFSLGCELPASIPHYWFKPGLTAALKDMAVSEIYT